MNMNWFEGLIYGLVSGLTEFLPISSHAHQRLLMQMFGVEQRDPVRDLFVHLAILLAVFSGCKTMIEHLLRNRNQRIHNRSGQVRTARILMDERFVKNAAVPMIVGMLIFSYVFETDANLLSSAAFLFINGIILFVSGRMLQGNKDVRSMTYLDSLLIGCFTSLSAFTGISRVGCVTSAAIARGADRQNSLNWAFLLSIPALILLSGMDLLKIFSGGAGISFWGSFFTYLFSAAGAYIAGNYSLRFMRFLTVRIGFSGFSYYCWGTSLFSFLLYLMVA